MKPSIHFHVRDNVASRRPGGKHSHVSVRTYRCKFRIWDGKSLTVKSVKITPPTAKQRFELSAIVKRNMNDYWMARLSETRTMEIVPFLVP